MSYLLETEIKSANIFTVTSKGVAAGAAGWIDHQNGKGFMIRSTESCHFINFDNRGPKPNYHMLDFGRFKEPRVFAASLKEIHPNFSGKSFHVLSARAWDEKGVFLLVDTNPAGLDRKCNLGWVVKKGDPKVIWSTGEVYNGKNRAELSFLYLRPGDQISILFADKCYSVENVNRQIVRNDEPADHISTMVEFKMGIALMMIPVKNDNLSPMFAGFKMIWTAAKANNQHINDERFAKAIERADAEDFDFPREFVTWCGEIESLMSKETKAFFQKIGFLKQITVKISCSSRTSSGDKAARRRELGLPPTQEAPVVQKQPSKVFSLEDLMVA